MSRERQTANIECWPFGFYMLGFFQKFIERSSMLYKDVLYGEWELPEFLKKISQTDEMARLRGITQSVLPNGMMPYGTIPSRFHHGLGVAYLATKVLEKNPQISDYGVLLRASALLHDAGNPPFSHLSEHFLEEMTGMNGESFLAEILDGGETEKILKEYGLTIEQVVKFVTGQDKPQSIVLNGSMDIDNLDNVARYAYSIGLKGAKYDGVKIASAFRFSEKEWALDTNSRGETKKWQSARAKVYSAIYGAPHLNVAMMLYRAVELAFSEGDIRKDFFFLDDENAVYYLLMTCNPGTQSLVTRANRWDWYEEVFAFETTAPSDAVSSFTNHWKGRTILADSIAEMLKIGKEKVCVYAGRGKDKRNIDLPFTPSDPLTVSNNEINKPINRIKVYIAPECANLAKEILEFMSEKINAPVF